jgi:hypothetical protein
MTTWFKGGIGFQKGIGCTLIGGGNHGTATLVGDASLETRTPIKVEVVQLVQLRSHTTQCGVSTTSDWRSPNVVDLCRK